MSAQKSQDGGLAFPMESRDIPGMTLRDYFAAKAMAGWLASDIAGTADRIRAAAEHVAETCYLLADAMLVERAKGGPR